MGKTYVHIVWSPTVGPMHAYTNPSVAFAHAGTMSGVDVKSLEVVSRLPPTFYEDLSQEFEGDDDTPVDTRPQQPPADPPEDDDMSIEVAVDVRLSDIDDSGPKSR